MRKSFLFFTLTYILFSCTKENKFKVDISDISIDVTTVPFHEKFYTSTPESLSTLKEEYPLLFPENVSDSVWNYKASNKDELQLFAEVNKVYPNLDKISLDLEYLFKHIKYYYPQFIAPTVYTVITNLDYDYRVIFTPKNLFISLDLYLGSNHGFYNDYPDYIKQNNIADRIVVDVADNIIKTQVNGIKGRDFLSKIITEGKKMYLLDSYLPKFSDTLKIGYSAKKYLWAKDNEENIWQYVIENKLLYKTDTKLNKRFIENAPFSKFYLSEDNKSPGRIGVWLGWQIVRSYMENNDVSLQSLLQKSTSEIFKNSKYKPRK